MICWMININQTTTLEDQTSGREAQKYAGLREIVGQLVASYVIENGKIYLLANSFYLWRLKTIMQGS